LKILLYLQDDYDGNTNINWEEFIAVTVPLNKTEHKEHLMAALTYFDKDGGDYITVDELQKASVEHEMKNAFLEDTIYQVDQNNVSLPSDSSPSYGISDFDKFVEWNDSCFAFWSIVPPCLIESTLALNDFTLRNASWY
jgi:hypothetical protein